MGNVSKITFEISVKYETMSLETSDIGINNNATL